MPDANSPIRIPVPEQPKDRLYEMSLRFIGDAIPAELDELLSWLNTSEQIKMKDAVTLRMRQTVPFIPDDNTIAKYVEIMEQNPQRTNVKITNIRFDGYDYIYAVQPGSPDDEP